MDKIISISFGELFLKGKNRSRFVDRARTNIKFALEGLGVQRTYMEHGKLYIEANNENFDNIIERLEKVFGISHISPTLRCEKEIKSMEEGVHEYLTSYARDSKTFKIVANRADKSFPIKSPEINQKFGGYVLKNFEGLKVDVHNPDLELNIDIRSSHAYIYGEKFQGAGGLPVGTSSKGLCLLSGGIDSPVAAYMMAKRGVEVDMVHFNSYPFTSDRSLEKVLDLAGLVARYSGPHKLYNINLLNIQKEINEKCQPKNMTILSRRFMMRIADELAARGRHKMLITGESLGQVASQTIEGLTATNSVTKRPVLRPLIGFDKEDIIHIAKKIQTYETSILPYEDCCTVFQPSNPNIKPSIKELEEEEAKLDVGSLVEEALEDIDLIKVGAKY